MSLAGEPQSLSTHSRCQQILFCTDSDTSDPATERQCELESCCGACSQLTAQLHLESTKV